MQASITYSPLPTKFIKFRTISSKQNPIFHQTKPFSHLTLCNFQPQSPLNTSILKSSKIFTSNLGPLRCGISSNSESANEGGRSFRGWIEVAGEAISTMFPLWVTVGCVLGLVRPNLFNWVTPKLSIVGLSVTMLGMGMTLSLDDLFDALSMPKEVLSGFVLQYSVMPLSAFLISKLLNLPSHYAVGLILVGCCPGGTASNIVTYLARGNVALSVIMTAASTLSAVIMTPFLTAKLAGKYVANAALGVVLATKHFGDPLTTVPSAVSSVCHSLFGSILAAIWRFSVSVPAEIKD